jgi:structural maintenance of chromosome 3 (chondroitin sulfate proteoglycan 6)
VSKGFATIFERLVPAGHGRLVIQRRADRRPDPEESDEEQRSSVANYVGVGISVSFNSKVMDEQQRIQQLSGGQKSKPSMCIPSMSSLETTNHDHRSLCSLSDLRSPTSRI